MPRLSTEYFIPFAEQLANASGEVVRRYFRQRYELELKPDATPVTQADKESERAMRAMIRNTFPDHGVMGEEFGDQNVDAEYVWIIDPIDGTKSFIIGRPIFGTLIALTHKGKPVLGIIDQPILGERWVGVNGHQTYFNNRDAQVRACPYLQDAVMCTTSPHLFSREETKVYNDVRKQVHDTIYGGDCYNYGLLASGTVDVVIEASLKPHDYCAFVPIIENAGGVVTDWQGNPLTLSSSDGRVLACGDKKLHQKILKILAAI